MRFCWSLFSKERCDRDRDDTFSRAAIERTRDTDIYIYIYIVSGNGKLTRLGFKIMSSTSNKGLTGLFRADGPGESDEPTHVCGSQCYYPGRLGNAGKKGSGGERGRAPFCRNGMTINATRRDKAESQCDHEYQGDRTPSRLPSRRCNVTAKTMWIVQSPRRESDAYLCSGSTFFAFVSRQANKGRDMRITWILESHCLRLLPGPAAAEFGIHD